MSVDDGGGGLGLEALEEGQVWPMLRHPRRYLLRIAVAGGELHEQNIWVSTRRIAFC